MTILSSLSTFVVNSTSSWYQVEIGVLRKRQETTVSKTGVHLLATEEFEDASTHSGQVTGKLTPAIHLGEEFIECLTIYRIKSQSSV